MATPNATLQVPKLPFVRGGTVELFHFRLDLRALGEVAQDIALRLSAIDPELLPRAHAVWARVNEQLVAFGERRAAPLDALIHALHELADSPGALAAIREQYRLDWNIDWKWHRRLPYVNALRAEISGEAYVGNDRYELRATALVPDVLLESVVVTTPDGRARELIVAPDQEAP